MRLVCRISPAVDLLIGLALGRRCRKSIPAVWKELASLTDGSAIPPDPWALTSILACRLNVHEIDAMTFPELVRCFPEWMTESEFFARYTDEARELLRSLESSGFVRLYEEKCVPVLSEWNERLTESVEGCRLDELNQAVSKLCPEKSGEALRIYTSYFSYPSTFMMSDRALVSSCRMGGRMLPGPLLARLIHELIHGTIQPQVMAVYDDLCRDDFFLSQTRAVLSDRMAGLREEELVTGLSEFIAVRYGLRRQDEALRQLGSASEYSMPVAVALFGQLLRCGELPENPENWLVRFLSQLRETGVRAAAESVSPGYGKCFERCSRREPSFPVKGLLL